MYICLLMFIVMMLGWAGPSHTETLDRVDWRKDVCPTSHGNPDFPKSSVLRCRRSQSWWQDVGEALSGAATAARFPRP